MGVGVGRIVTSWRLCLDLRPRCSTNVHRRANLNPIYIGCGLTSGVALKTGVLPRRG